MKKEEKHELEAEVADLYVTMAIVFSGKLKNLYQTLDFLNELGVRVIYRKAAKGKLLIVKEGEE